MILLPCVIFDYVSLLIYISSCLEADHGQSYSRRCLLALCDGMLDLIRCERVRLGNKVQSVNRDKGYNPDARGWRGKKYDAINSVIKFEMALEQYNRCAPEFNERPDPLQLVFGDRWFNDWVDGDQAAQDLHMETYESISLFSGVSPTHGLSTDNGPYTVALTPAYPGLRHMFSKKVLERTPMIEFPHEKMNKLTNYIPSVRIPKSMAQFVMGEDFFSSSSLEKQ